ncbi:integrase [Mucilaginibacter sp. UYNi724]
MATAKIVTWSRPDKEGQYPIGFKIYKNGKPSYIFEGQTLPNRELWDAKKQEVKKSHPNAARLTNLLTKRLAELRNKALQLETDQHKVDVAEIKEAYKQIYNPTPNPKLLFKTFAKSYLDEKRALGKYEVYHTDINYIKRLLKYAGNDNLTFPEITVDFLRGWIVFLKQIKRVYKDETKPVQFISDRTITNHLISIRTIFNRAITDKVISADIYPFSGKGKISIKLQGSKKIGPEEWEIKRIEELDLSEHSSIIQDARNIWLTEFYFAGMRVTDCLLLKWTDFQNGRLYYQMSKNGEHGSVKLPDKAKLIIEQYRGGCSNKINNPHNLVFPLLQGLPSLNNHYELRRHISYAVSRLNKGMRIIMEMIGSTKNGSQHKARHAFAQRAEEKDVHPKVLQKLYRHESILTTMIYQSNFSFKKADEAVDSVLNF